MKMDRRTAILGAVTFAAVGAAEGAAAEAAEAQTPTQAEASAPMERVLGIGGLFFRSHDPKQLTLWYQTHLGVGPVPNDASQKSWQQAAGPTAFSPFSMSSSYMGPKEQMWMVNFRVRNLDAMVAQLQKAQIEVKVDPEKYPYGRFARLHDPEGNPIELWEAVNAS